MNPLDIGREDKVLVTGATGFTGSHLLHKLCATGASIHAIARESSDRSAFDELPVQWHIGDVFDSQVVSDGTQGVNYVFHVAAAFREAGVSDDVYENVHVLSTRLLLDAIEKQRADGLDFKRFVHVSTAGVHGHIDAPPADESYRFSPGDLYQQTKVQGEQLLQGMAGKHNLPFTIIRPCAIYGPGDRRLLKLFKMAKLPVCPILGLNNKGLYHLIHVEDLTHFMCQSATAAEAAGETYIVGNPQATSIEHIIRHIATQLQTQPRFVRVPVTPVMALAWLCEKLCKAIKVEPPLYPRRVAFFTKDRSFDTRKMQALPGFDYQYTNESGLDELTRWYQQQGWL